jgi:hypothetical protein
MEYSDTIDTETIAAAVRLTRALGSASTAPLSELAAKAVSQTFCTCVTEGEDAAERQFSAIHARLVEQVASLAGSETEPTEQSHD